jgi:POT family proton-dependent oligopeptide transporter
MIFVCDGERAGWNPHIHNLKKGFNMSIAQASRQHSAALPDSTTDTGGLGGHPRGLTTLFFTEMWERFSFYGMRAILVLYMVALPMQGGLGFDTKEAASIYGTYSMAAFLLSLPGGILADRFLGARRAVFLGGLIIACGHFTMAFHSLATFYTGLVLVACGTGLLKPNVSTMVGSLYSEHDNRRDSGFSLFYMGINIGAFLAPLACGYLAEAQGFKDFIVSVGFSPTDTWHFGFAAAGVGMLLGLVVYWLQRDRLQHVGNYRAKTPELELGTPRKPVNQAIYTALTALTLVGTYLAGSNWQAVLPFLLAFDALVIMIVLGIQEKLTALEWRRMGAILIFFAVTIAFWSAYEQKGSSLNLLAKNLVDRKIGDFEMPASWFQSLTAMYVIILAPVFAALWLRLGKRQPSSPLKFVLSLVFIAIGYGMFTIVCSHFEAGGKISPWWLALLFLFEVLGELCMSPVGLSTITKLAPVKLVGLMMGIWFFGSSFGYKLAGYFAGFYAPESAALVKLYGGLALGVLAVAAVLLLLLPFIKKLIGDENVVALK